MRTKNNSSKFCYKFSFSFIDQLGFFFGAIFINFVFWGCLLTGYYIVSGVVALWLFLLFHKRRWVRYFCKKYFEVFHIRKYRDRISYNNVTLIKFEEPPFSLGLLQVFYKDKFGKIKRAQFEQKNNILLVKVLNFIKHNLDDDIIDDKSLIFANITFENGEYKYKAGLARKYRQGKL